eukprot:m.142911 g.142911  ORF g.142911 m.142911 type:complete len:53 (+) comp56599_c0_seq1:63-221(+)
MCIFAVVIVFGVFLLPFVCRVCWDEDETRTAIHTACSSQRRRATKHGETHAR